jgi:hypothetical protein
MADVSLTSEAPAHVPDVYFSKEYGTADAAVLGGTWLSACTPTGEWQMPMVVTDDGGVREGISPYGYSGIHVQEDLTDESAGQYWKEARSQLASQGLVSAFLRFSPLDPHSVSRADGFDGLVLRRAGTTYRLEVEDPELMWKRMEGRARTEVRKARNQELTTQVRPLEREDVRAGAPFRTLYEATMQRVDAGERYYFSDEYFDGLSIMGSGGSQLATVSHQGGVVSAAIILRHQSRAHYHLSGSDRDAARSGANSLMIWAVMEWCHAQQITAFHLGGGVSESDGLARFKRSFGGEALDFHVGCAVLNAAEYEKRTEERARALGVTVEALEATGYFPAFRATPP